jgi:hypothetical protein
VPDSPAPDSPAPDSAAPAPQQHARGGGLWTTVALLCAALAAAAPAAAAMAGTTELAAVLFVEQLAFGWAWVAVLRASRPIVLLLAAAAIAADGAVLGATRHDLGALAGVVGAGLAVVIVYQLVHRGLVGPGTAAGAAAATGPVRARVTAELAAALGGGTLVAFLAGLLALRTQPGAPAPGELLVAVGLAGAGGAVLVAWLSGLLGAGTLVAGGLGLAVGTGLGAAYGALADDLSASSGALLAAAGALAAAVMGVLIARAGSAPVAATGTPVPAAPPRTGPTRAGAVPLWVGGMRMRPVSMRPVATALVAAVAPLTLAAPLVYLVGRHLPG